ncbi:SURF1 family protein [Fontimonas thermophila]|uniref:SURF1-like protein n=1 Tax=Fontimonas thermophila TaxID=1076937 RepID=A0A1I2JXA4_9GAMM|nr:SURF1 family protein [Fontimonas thermophila]
MILVLVLGGTMVGLGIWQIQRGFEKAELLARYRAADSQTPRELTAGGWAEAGVIERALARGHFDADRQLLLDNQSHDHIPGYRVWTPLILVHGGIVVVDRGWIPAGGDRSQLPALPVPQGEVTVKGYWRAPPEPGLRVQTDNCAGGPWPRIVQYPTVDDLRCIYGESTASGILLMDADLPGGFVRDWTGTPELSPNKHYAYAAQWFAFTLVLLVIFVKFSFRPRPT